MACTFGGVRLAGSGSLVAWQASRLAVRRADGIRADHEVTKEVCQWSGRRYGAAGCGRARRDADSPQRQFEKCSVGGPSGGAAISTMAP